MKKSILILGLITLIIACNKEDEPKFIDEPSDEVVKYQIYLFDNQISGYKKYINDEFAEKADYYDSDSVIEMIRTNASGDVIEKVTYRMNDNYLARSATDSVFSDSGLYVAKLEYEYQNDYLIKAVINWKNLGAVVDSGQFTVTKTIDNDNIDNVNTSFPNWLSGCTDYFEYGDQLNKIDIINLTPGITGKISQNLREHASWNNGCPCGPSSSIPLSDYEYNLNENGYVTRMTETYTPCYHLISPGEVIRTVKTTIYEYDIR
jgi:hypothetical protein